MFVDEVLFWIRWVVDAAVDTAAHMLSKAGVDSTVYFGEAARWVDGY